MPTLNQCELIFFFFFFFYISSLSTHSRCSPIASQWHPQSESFAGPSSTKTALLLALHHLPHQQMSVSIIAIHLRPNVLEPPRERCRAPFLSSSQGCLLAQFQRHHPSCTRGTWFLSEHIFKEYRHPSQQIAL